MTMYATSMSWLYLGGGRPAASASSHSVRICKVQKSSRQEGSLPARMAFFDRIAACSSTFRMYLRPCKTHEGGSLRWH